MNLAICIGNLGADAEVVSSNGKSFVSFSVADSRKYKRQDGSEVSETNWIDAIISDVNHPVVPFLKAGVKVAIIGMQSLRVFSSKKDRMMKAGQTVHVLQIELCGGSSDNVPKELIVPETGAIVHVSKLFWAAVDVYGMDEEEKRFLIDKRGNQYMYDSRGFITPVLESKQDEDETSDNKVEPDSE